MREWQAASGDEAVSVKAETAEDAIYEALGHALTWKVIAHEAARQYLGFNAPKKEVAEFLVAMASQASQRLPASGQEPEGGD